MRKEEILDRLNKDRVWHAESERITAIRDVENSKGVKYGEKILKEHSGEEFDPYYLSLDGDKAQLARISLENLKKLVKAAKMAESDRIAFVVEDNKPLMASLVKDAEFNGEMLIAPIINEDDFNE